MLAHQLASKTSVCCFLHCCFGCRHELNIKWHAANLVTSWEENKNVQIFCYKTKVFLSFTCFTWEKISSTSYSVHSTASLTSSAQSYGQRATMCAGFHSNQSWYSSSSTFLISCSCISMDYHVWLLLVWEWKPLWCKSKPWPQGGRQILGQNPVCSPTL